MRNLLGFGTGLVALACASTMACSGKQAQDSSTTTLRSVPAPPSGPPAPTSATRTFALSKIFLGDTLPDGSPSTVAWKTLGYDLDGKVSTRGSTDVCTPHDGAGKDQQADGDDGIDNAWASRVVPLLQTLRHEVSVLTTASIRNGDYTHLFALDGLTDDPRQTNTRVSGQVLLGAPLGRAPGFTLSDLWPAAVGSLAEGQLANGAKTSFASGYVTNGRWVGAPAGDLVLHVGMAADPAVPESQPFFFDLPIHRAVVTFEHPGAAVLTNGTIAGVISVDALVVVAQSLLSGNYGPFCTPSSFDVGNQIRQAADIMLDGPNAPGAACDAVSIGIGFEASEIANVASVGADPAPAHHPCGSDAGKDAGDAGTDGP